MAVASGYFFTGTPGAGQVASFYADVSSAFSAIGTWIVHPLVIQEPGGARERGVWVVEHPSGPQLIFVVPNATNLVSQVVDTSALGGTFVAFEPGIAMDFTGGGTAPGAGNFYDQVYNLSGDTDTAGFWSSQTRRTQVHPVGFWATGFSNVEFVVIGSSAIEPSVDVAFYTRSPTTNSGRSITMMLFSDTLIDDSNRAPGDRLVNKEGVILVEAATSGTPGNIAPSGFRYSVFRDDDTRYELINNPGDDTRYRFSGFASEAAQLPSGTTYQAHTLPLFIESLEGQIVGRARPDLFLFAPQDFTTIFGLNRNVTTVPLPGSMLHFVDSCYGFWATGFNGFFDPGGLTNAAISVSFATVAEAQEAAATTLSPGDTVEVSWTADLVTSAGIVTGTVQPDGTISPSLLDVVDGVPFKALGATYIEQTPGVGVIPTIEGYPEVDNTTFSGTLGTGLDGNFFGLTDYEIWVSVDIPAVNNTGGGTPIVALDMEQQAPNSGTFATAALDQSGTVRQAHSLVGFQSSSIGALDYFGGGRQIKIYYNATNANPQPNYDTGVISVVPSQLPAALSNIWPVSAGDWTVGDGPETEPGFEVGGGAIVGNGRVRFERLRIVGPQNKLSLGAINDYPTILAAEQAVAGLTAGDRVRVQWTADAVTDAGEVIGVVQHNGTIDPPLLSHPEGVPFKALGATLTVSAGQAIPIVNGYPEVLNSTISSYSQTDISGLFEGITGYELWVDINIPNLNSVNGVTSVCGTLMEQLAPASGSMFVFAVEFFGQTIQSYNHDGDFQSSSVGATDYFNGGRTIKYIYTTTNEADQPSYDVGFNSVDPPVTYGKLSDVWNVANGNWNDDKGPASNVAIYVQPGSTVGVGTVRFERIRLRGASVELTP